MDVYGRKLTNQELVSRFSSCHLTPYPAYPLRSKTQKHCRRFFCRGNAHCLCSAHFTPADQSWWNTMKHMPEHDDANVNMMYTSHLKSRTSNKLYRFSPTNLFIAVPKFFAFGSPQLLKLGWSLVRSARSISCFSCGCQGPASHAGGSLVRQLEPINVDRFTQQKRAWRYFSNKYKPTGIQANLHISPIHVPCLLFIMSKFQIPGSIPLDFGNP